MTTIQDRIIEIIKKHNNDVMSFPTPRELLNANKRLEQFLLTSIKEAEEETRKEIAQEFLNKSPAILKPSLRKGYFLAMLILKSITNKEKQK